MLSTLHVSACDILVAFDDACPTSSGVKFGESTVEIGPFCPHLVETHTIVLEDVLRHVGYSQRSRPCSKQ